MGRRGAAYGFFRRSGGGGGGGSGGGSADGTALSILGALLLREFDARVGVATGPRTWTDQIASMVLTGVGTPLFNTDGVNFRGLPTWRFDFASSQYMDSGGAGGTIIPSASPNMYCSMVGRATSAADTGVVQSYVGLLDNALTQFSIQPNRPAGGAHAWNCFMCGASAISSPVAGDTNVHLFEMYLSPTGTLKFDIDGVGVADNATAGLVTLAAVQRINIGAWVSGPNFLSNFRIARLRICSSAPNAAQRAQLRVLDQQIWGVP